MARPFPALILWIMFSSASSFSAFLAAYKEHPNALAMVVIWMMHCPS